MTPPGYREGPAYYNDADPFCCEWLQRLMDAGEITPGTIDNRSITDVKPDDLAGYERVHFFAGIGGWELAMRLAGWSGPVWTGSCPCQPYSAAGKRQGDADPRNLWPAFFRLIRECRPPVVFGEQVSSAIRHGWLDGVCGDLEAESYAVGAAVLGAHSVGAPHIRQRLYWCARLEYTADARRSEEGQSEQSSGRGRLSGVGCGVDGLGHAESDHEQRLSVAAMHGQGESAGGSGGVGGLAHPRVAHAYVCTEELCPRDGAAGKPSEVDRLGDTTALRRPWGNGTGEQKQGAWSRCAIVRCRDNKARRVPSLESGIFPLAYGIPRSLRPLQSWLASLGYSTAEARRMLRQPRSILATAARNRVGRLKAYGNAIVPPVAAEFLRAYMEARYADT